MLDEAKGLGCCWRILEENERCISKLFVHSLAKVFEEIPRFVEFHLAIRVQTIGFWMRKTQGVFMIWLVLLMLYKLRYCQWYYVPKYTLDQMEWRYTLLEIERENVFNSTLCSYGHLMDHSWIASCGNWWMDNIFKWHAWILQLERGMPGL